MEEQSNGYSSIRSHVESLPQFTELCNSLVASFRPVLDNHIAMMIDAALNFNQNEHPYEIANIDGVNLIAYKFGDSSSVKIRHGYQTMLLYIYLHENNSHVMQPSIVTFIDNVFIREFNLKLSKQIVRFNSNVVRLAMQSFQRNTV